MTNEEFREFAQKLGRAIEGISLQEAYDEEIEREILGLQLRSPGLDMEDPPQDWKVVEKSYQESAGQEGDKTSPDETDRPNKGRRERPQGHEEIDLSDDDEAALESAWQKIQERVKRGAPWKGRP